MCLDTYNKHHTQSLGAVQSQQSAYLPVFDIAGSGHDTLNAAQLACSRAHDSFYCAVITQCEEQITKQTHDLIELNDKLQNEAKRVSKQRDEAIEARDEAVRAKESASKAVADAQAEVAALKKAQAEQESQHSSGADAELVKVKQQVSCLSISLMLPA